MGSSKQGGNGNGKGHRALGEVRPGDAAFLRLGELLAADGWHAQRLGESHVYRLHCTGKHGSFACYAQVRVDLEQLLFYAVCPVRIPEEARLRVAEFITRANYGMRIGNFELDFGDGELRFKTSLDFEGTDLDAGLVRGLVYPAVHTLDAYLPGVLAVAHGEKTPLEAVRMIEDPDED